jgi:hypothetical protein
MQGTRKTRLGAAFGIAPWVVAGALLLGADTSTTAQDATPPAEAGTEGTLPTTDEGAAPAADQATEGAVEVAADTAAPANAAATDAATDEGGRNREGRGGNDDVAAVPAVGTGTSSPGNSMAAVAVAAAIGAGAAGAALRGRPSGR